MRAPAMFTAAVFGCLVAFTYNLAWANSNDSSAVTYRNWSGQCDDRSCIAKNDDGITIYFDAQHYTYITFPATKRQMNTMKGAKVELPDGLFVLSTLEPDWKNMTLKVMIAPHMRGDLSESDYVTIDGLGDISISNFEGFYRVGAAKLGLDDSKKVPSDLVLPTPPVPSVPSSSSISPNSTISVLELNVERLIGRTDAYDVICRGSSGDERATLTACKLRDETLLRLSRDGVCYGKADQEAYEMKWHKCGEGSIRP
ncbi:hypothetical protein CFBP6625_06300 [Agrobacterium tumefaciens]|nr:hypothetical protein CFBP6625_06300 [Agrobacterium tumefaciens]